MMIVVLLLSQALAMQYPTRLFTEVCKQRHYIRLLDSGEGITSTLLINLKEHIILYR